uniref:Competence coiA family protein n=1 Tax=Streptomyces sp. F12 TaxID=1436084 RepID=V9ZAM4_9ACTN|nr:competence protein CoiA family protein [Streptomyces sp. F12]AHE40486.1 Competence coiA family protein [Streptomyces sp. F12]
MALTAQLPQHGTLDVTLDGLGCGLAWEAVDRARPRPALACTHCGRPMHAKVSPRGGRFFAHDRRFPACPGAGETEEHRSLKRALAAAAREAGHKAQLEFTAAHYGWRADVLVTAAQGRRTALEAQLSSASVDDVLARTRRYSDDNLAAVWFTHRAARWLTHVPAARLYRPSGPDGPWNRTHPLVSRFSVVACPEVCDPSPFWHGPVHAGWDHDEERTLTEFVADVLSGRLVPRRLTTALGTRYHGWAAPEDVKAADDHAASPPTVLPVRSTGEDRPLQ